MSKITDIQELKWEYASSKGQKGNYIEEQPFCF